MGSSSSRALVPLRNIPIDRQDSHYTHHTNIDFKANKNSHQTYGDFPGHMPDLFHFITSKLKIKFVPLEPVSGIHLEIL